MNTLEHKQRVAGTYYEDKSWIVYGPEGCGKTINKERILAALRLKRIRDEWDGRKRSFVAMNTLHLCQIVPAWLTSDTNVVLRRVITFDEAMVLVLAHEAKCCK